MKKNTRIAIIAAAAPLLMFGAAFAGVPLYKLFCETTGYGGTTKVATKAADRVLEQKVKVSFDANVSEGVSWEFKPLKRDIELKLGENALAFYTIKNNGSKPITAIANYNVTPHKSAIYFAKLECFCFKNQTLAPGESLELPVVFYVDPRMATDSSTKDVKEITLSYTFYEAKNQAQNIATIKKPI